MNTRILAGALCAATIIATPSALQAQPESPSGPGAPSERPGAPFWKKHGKPGGPMMPGLPPEEAQRLAEAREKAKDAPTVRSLQEARQALDEQLERAVDAAMLAADPGLAPTLEKVRQARERAKGMRDRFQSLTPEQRQQLRAARQAAQADPAVAAAREKVKTADSPEARRAAAREMHEAMKAAITRQNPDLAPLLDQLGPPRGPQGPQGPSPGPGDE
jgi:Spy/CpxP family protein refolding chaperone